MSEIAMENIERENFHTEDYDRSLVEYEEALHILREDLRGKTVLDIGSGRNLRFARDAAEEGIKVISVNPELAFDESMRRELGTSWPRRLLTKIFPKRFRSETIKKRAKSRTIAARAQSLPLQDESADIILGLHSVPSYLHSPEEMELTFDELMRVLKPGGVGYFRYFARQIEDVNAVMKKYREKEYSVEQNVDNGWNWQSDLTDKPAKYGRLKIVKPKLVKAK